MTLIIKNAISEGRQILVQEAEKGGPEASQTATKKEIQEQRQSQESQVGDVSSEVK